MNPETEVNFPLTAVEANLMLACIDETVKKYGLSVSEGVLTLARKIRAAFPAMEEPAKEAA